MTPASDGVCATPELNERARKVLAAATAVFLAHGFSAATTDMIQQEAGVSKSTVYAHFSSKEALFKAVIEARCAAFAAMLQGISFEQGDIARVLRRLGQAYLAVVLSEDGLALYRVVIAEAPRFPELARTFYLAGPKTVAGMAVQRLAEAAAAGEIDVQSVGVEAAARLFFSLLRGEGQLECLTHPATPASPAQIDRWVEVAVATFLRAFGGRAG